MIFDTVKKIIVEQLDVDADAVTMDAEIMKDLEADSLDAVEIILAVEEEYGIEIPDEDAEKLSSIADIVNYIEEHK
ncbi:MAG: acyl carrier protein [Mogibacterium sp.]|nr:acyl carrier protein [Mogibacterium sp.]